ncbi:MAG: glycosyl hydrolase family 79 C-terminal domain-containing protein [Solirubrobacteraceae bacterium]
MRLLALALLSLALPSVAAAAASSQQTATIVQATISSSPYSQPMPPGFLGFSFEYKAIHQYTGRNPGAINPVFLSLIRQLNPGQAPVIRIGGNSTDYTWWPIRGEIPPGGVNYALTPGWLRTTRAFASQLGAKMIMGINLEAARPALAAQEGRALLTGLGQRNISAFEIGNEADLYPQFNWYTDRNGIGYLGRPQSYNSMTSYIDEFTRWRHALPPVPLAGPSFALPNWMTALPSFLSAEPSVAYVTYHRYPLRACISNPLDPIYPSVSNLLADTSSAGLASSLVTFVEQAHAAGVKFRLDELNSASCRGKAGLSDTFVSSLWVLDTLFNFAANGVDGINLHTLPGAPYQPFTFTQTKGVWGGVVKPVYYGMLMFAQADPPAATLLNVSAPAGPLKLWATQAPDGHIRVVAINKDLTNSYTVQLQLPDTGAPSPPASLETLTAPSFQSTTGVQLGGQSFADGTTSGALSGALQTTTVQPAGNQYTITVQPASAAMLTR